MYRPHINQTPVHYNLQDTSSVAHKLSGQILEQLKQPDKALACYKKAQVNYCCVSDTGIAVFNSLIATDISTSQELEPSPDLVTKICGLMAELPVEPGRAKYWVEVRAGGQTGFETR